jgi:hypothetical protein
MKTRLESYTHAIAKCRVKFSTYISNQRLRKFKEELPLGF